MGKFSFPFTCTDTQEKSEALPMKATTCLQHFLRAPTPNRSKVLYPAMGPHNRTAFEVRRPYSFQRRWPCQLADRPPSPFTLPLGSPALLHSSSIPGLRSDFFVGSVSVLPLILVLLRPVGKGREKKGNAGCVFLGLSRGFFFFFFF